MRAEKYKITVGEPLRNFSVLAEGMEIIYGQKRKVYEVKCFCGKIKKMQRNTLFRAKSCGCTRKRNTEGLTEYEKAYRIKRKLIRDKKKLEEKC